MTNAGLEAALAGRGIRLLRAEVGDRNVLEAMLREGPCWAGSRRAT